MAKTFTKEKDVKAEVKKLLATHQWMWWMPAANGFGTQGVPDFLAVRGGVFLAVETKFGDGKPTALQKQFLGGLAKEQCFAFVVNERSVGWLAVWLLAFDRAVAAEADGKTVDPADGAAMLDAIKVMTADY